LNVWFVGWLVDVCAHVGVNDLLIVDQLVFRGRKSFEEIQMVWKQKPHVMVYFDNAPSEESTVAELDAFRQGYHSRRQLQ